MNVKIIISKQVNFTCQIPRNFPGDKDKFKTVIFGFPTLREINVYNNYVNTDNLNNSEQRNGRLDFLLAPFTSNKKHQINGNQCEFNFPYKFNTFSVSVIYFSFGFLSTIHCLFSPNNVDYLYVKLPCLLQRLLNNFIQKILFHIMHQV